MCDVKRVASRDKRPINDGLVHLIFAKEAVFKKLHENFAQLAHRFCGEVVALHERFACKLMLGVFVACGDGHRCLKIKNQTIFMAFG